MRLTTILGALAGFTMSGAAFAQSTIDNALGDLEIIGKPVPQGTSFQPAVTELARDINWLDNFVFVIIAIITIFVTALLAYAAFAFAAKRNPTPKTFTHNSTIEVAWTIIPIIILVVIGAFSIPVLFKQQRIPEGDIVIKVTGYQWYWGYEYVDEGFAFDSFMIGAGENRLTPDISAEVSAGDRHRRGCPRGQDHCDAGHWRGCDPFLDDPLLRGEARCGAGSFGAAVVHGRARRCLLRAMLRTVRPGPCLYAHHRESGVGRGLCRMAVGCEGRICWHRACLPFDPGCFQLTLAAG